MRNTVLIMIILVFGAGCKSNNMRENDNKDETASLIIYFSLHPKEVIHKEQALVEIYNQVGTSPTDHLLELEYHAPYEKLMPGQEMKTSETWKLLEYNGNDNPEEHIAFIKNNILK